MYFLTITHICLSIEVFSIINKRKKDLPFPDHFIFLLEVKVVEVVILCVICNLCRRINLAISKLLYIVMYYELPDLYFVMTVTSIMFQVVIISGETGCGKTTQIPQYILESEIDSDRGAFCNIICTQPRRISAITVSERVASERGEELGESVSIFF